MRFEFVQVNDKKDHDKIREHLRNVQSEQWRKRAKGASGELKAKSVVASGPLAWRQKSSVRATARGRNDKRKSIATKTFKPRSGGSGSAIQAEDVELVQHLSKPASPLDGLSAARKDPFTTYPIAWDPEVDVNFDFLVHSFGPAMFGYTPNPNYDLFHSQAKIALSDPAAFHAVMILTAMHRGRMYGRCLPGMRVLWHRIEAIRIINARFRTQDLDQCLSEGSIFAVMVLSGAEKQWNAIGDREVETTGLRQLVIQKGGLKALHQQCPELELALYGLALLTPGMINPGLPALYEPSLPHCTRPQEQRLLAQELLDFLSLVNVTAEEQSGMHTDLIFAFAPDTALHQLLASPRRISGIYQNKMEIVQARLRGAILVYVHWMVLQSRDRKDLLNFSEHLRFVVRLEWLWKDSLRMLQWLLIKDQESTKLANHSVAWKTFRLVNTISTLDVATQSTIRDFLFGLLSILPLREIDMKSVEDQLVRSG